MEKESKKTKSTLLATRNPPWTNQHTLKDTRQIPKPKEVQLIIDGITEPRTQALVALLYLLGCRITEVTGENKRSIWERGWEWHKKENGDEIRKKTGAYYKKEIRTVNVQGLRPLDFETVYHKDIKVIQVSMPNRKNKTRTTKIIPIKLDKDLEKHLWLIISRYMKDFDVKSKLFDIHKVTAYKLIKKHTGFNPHWWRHIRLTHLVTRHNMNEKLIIRFAGWTDSRPAQNYMELDTTDLIEAL